MAVILNFDLYPANPGSNIRSLLNLTTFIPAYTPILMTRLSPIPDYNHGTWTRWELPLRNSFIKPRSAATRLCPKVNSLYLIANYEMGTVIIKIAIYTITTDFNLMREFYPYNIQTSFVDWNPNNPKERWKLIGF